MSEESNQSKKNDLFAWAEDYREFDLTAWERLPDIELYMDQVISYLGRMLCLQERCDGAPLLTASMVNNYVKAGYIPRPNGKKYDKSHLAALYILCSAKQSLSVGDAAAMQDMLQECCPPEMLYMLFGQRQKEIAEALTEPLIGKEKPDSPQLLNLALDMMLQASAYRLVSERILDHLKAERAEKEAQERAVAAAEREAKEAEAKRIKEEKEAELKKAKEEKEPEAKRIKEQEKAAAKKKAEEKTEKEQG